METTTTQSLACQLDPARAAALHIALARPGMPPTTGGPMPPFFHQIYFWAPEPPARLGRDGHPAVGAGLIPDMGLPRRMWGAGRLEFIAPIVLGTPAEKRSVVERTARKDGRTGPLAFVTLRHEIWQEGTLRLTEWQDLVYRADPAPGTTTPPPEPAPEGEGSLPLDFTSTLLFRYSALTLNGHRIHYDLPYATGTEGYAGLVVHGPLLAQLIALKASEAGPLAGFSFRGRSALICGEGARMGWRGEDYWIAGEDGRLCMSARVTR